VNFTRQELAERAASMATPGVYVGTSSWKYPGWCGTIYDCARYEYRGKFAETRFKRDCLREYAEVFKTVCVDAAYYTFPSEQFLQGMVDQTPDDFLFGLKVTDAITIKKFPKLDRFGEQAGRTNDNFLNGDLFVKAFLKPCEAVRASIGLLMFEFSRFWVTDYEHGRDSSPTWTGFSVNFRRAGPMASRCETETGSSRNISNAWLATRSRTCSTVGRRCRRWANRWPCLAVERTQTW